MAAQIDTSLVGTPGRAARRAVGGVIAVFFARLLAWRRHRALAQLSDVMLHDIGLTRADIEDDMHPPFRLP